MAFSSKWPNNIGWASGNGCFSLPAAGLCTGDPLTRCEYVPVSSASPSLARKVTVPPVPGKWAYVCSLKRLCVGRIAPIPPSEPPLALLQIGVAETGMSRLEGRARRRVLSVANLLHKPVGISATSGCPWGCKGLWTSKAPARCGVEHHDFTPLAQRLFMALSQNSPMSLVLAAS